ncbi:GNAT family N-acetyltransferase [Actinoplanes sp. KI2]|uniref:GNAT family N-acetyltransferase n=1 Tax=Actinoplanes sp. KI2 TaxID=2983315 RepID=UPI0021D5B3F8|nr:GNAT family N-acetyltransferase [Actinoplanes sp. KI2]MCU7725176.1 GNAT family N-acetyltransferase [Actinoplanes sp. KI2]
MTTVTPDRAVLDNPIWHSLTGAHAHLAELHGRAGRYPDEVAQFYALADPEDPGAWADLAELTGPGAEVAVAGRVPARLPGWELVAEIPGVQLVDVSLRVAPNAEAVRLTAADVPEILDLIERTRPGPFRPRTIELGTYLGIRRQGALVAMAGERMRPPGWTEISAVCTDPAYRGQGLATSLVRVVAAGIRARGETPFLHTAAENAPAIRLYEAIGFRLRRRTTFGRYRLIR